MMREHSAVDTIEKLRGAFETFMDLPFPDDSSDEDASQLHAELADFDGYVAGRIMTLISGGRLDRGELESDTTLKSRLDALANSDSAGAADSRKYLEYFRQLEALLELGRSLVR